MNLHPNLQTLLKFENEKALCPFCKGVLVGTVGELLECDYCTTAPLIFKNELWYHLVIKKNLIVMVLVNFKEDYIEFLFGDTAIPNLKIPHTKLPILNFMAMRHKIKKLLPFI
jgi:hypothetical protein